VSDRAVTANRRMLLRAIADHAAGKVTPGMARGEAEARALTGPIGVDMIAPAADWQDRWRGRDARRRSESPWASSHAAV
jgi:hypothetical protein